MMTYFYGESLGKIFCSKFFWHRNRFGWWIPRNQ